MATKRKEYGIFYMAKGKWTANPWKWDYEHITISYEDIINAVHDAKEHLKSRLMVLEYDGENWNTPSNKRIYNLTNH